MYRRFLLVAAVLIFSLVGLAFIMTPQTKDKAKAASFDLIQTPGDGRVFFMENSCKRHIIDFGTFLSWGFNTGMIRQVSREEFDSYPTAPPLTRVLNYNGNVYAIIDGMKAYVVSGEALVLNGFSWGDLQPFADPTFGMMPTAPPLTANGIRAVLIPSMGRIYYIENGYRRWIANWDTWVSFRPFTGDYVVAEGARELVEAPPLTRVLNYNGNVYAIIDGKKAYVTSGEALVMNGFSWGDLQPFAEPTFSQMPQAANLYAPRVVACPGGIFFLSGGMKHHIETWDTYLALNQQYVARPDCGGLPDGPGMTRLIQGPDGRVMWIESGTRRWIPDPGTFNGYGFNWGSIRGVGQDVIDALPEGASMARWVSSLDGIGIPGTSGRTGLEQHIWTNRGEGDAAGHYAITGVPATGPYSGITTQNGVAGTGAFGRIDPGIEQWYITMRWNYCEWYEDFVIRDGDYPSTQVRNCNASVKSWHLGKKVIVSNPANGRKLVAAVGESGPAIWVTNTQGVVSGLSPEGTDYLVGSRHNTGGDVLEYGWAVDQSLPLGPLNW